MYFLLVAMSQTPPSHTGSIIPSARQTPIVTLSTISAHGPVISDGGSHVLSSMDTGLHTTSSSSMGHTLSSVSANALHSSPSVNPITSAVGHATPSTGSEATSVGPHPKIKMINQALCSEINMHIAVPLDQLEFPDYCFAMNTDFSAKIRDNNKTLCMRQLAIVGLVLSALLNTCGGLLALVNGNNITNDIIDDWRNNLYQQLKCIPKWIYNTCVSMPILIRTTNDIRMFVKKSPRTITYNTHMFVRSPDGSSELADSDSVKICITVCCTSHI